MVPSRRRSLRPPGMERGATSRERAGAAGLVHRLYPLNGRRRANANPCALATRPTLPRAWTKRSRRGAARISGRGSDPHAKGASEMRVCRSGVGRTCKLVETRPGRWNEAVSLVARRRCPQAVLSPAQRCCGSNSHAIAQTRRADRGCGGSGTTPAPPLRANSRTF